MASEYCSSISEKTTTTQHKEMAAPFAGVVGDVGAVVVVGVAVLSKQGGPSGEMP